MFARPLILKKHLSRLSGILLRRPGGNVSNVDFEEHFPVASQQLFWSGIPVDVQKHPGGSSEEKYRHKSTGGGANIGNRHSGRSRYYMVLNILDAGSELALQILHQTFFRRWTMTVCLDTIGSHQGV